MTWNPRPKTKKLLALQQELLEEEKRSVRDIYYALEARGHNYDYGKIKRVNIKGRKNGYINPEKVVSEEDWIKTMQTGSTQSPKEWLENKLESWKYYDRNAWADQDYYVEVWLEKMSLASVFEPICREYNIYLVTGKGDASVEMKYKGMKRFIKAIQDGKTPVMLYFGDYNPSGCHAPVAILRSMAKLAREWFDVPFLPEPKWWNEYKDYLYFEVPGQDERGTGIFWDEAAEINKFFGMIFDRIALNLGQIEDEFPTNPTPKTSDKDETIRERFLEWNGGHDLNIELNAMKEFRREKLEKMIRDSIEEYIDMDKWENHNEAVKEDKKKLKEIMEEYEIPEEL